MKRCWIYCGTRPYVTSIERKEKIDLLYAYAIRKHYRVVEITSEEMRLPFVQCSGALIVLKAITNHKMDVLLIEKGILDKKDITIRTLFEYAKENGVKIQEVKLKTKGEK